MHAHCPSNIIQHRFWWSATPDDPRSYRQQWLMHSLCASCPFWATAWEIKLSPLECTERSVQRTEMAALLRGRSHRTSVKIWYFRTPSLLVTVSLTQPISTYVWFWANPLPLPFSADVICEWPHLLLLLLHLAILFFALYRLNGAADRCTLRISDSGNGAYSGKNSDTKCWGFHLILIPFVVMQNRIW